MLHAFSGFHCAEQPHVGQVGIGKDEDMRIVLDTDEVGSDNLLGCEMSNLFRIDEGL